MVEKLDSGIIYYRSKSDSIGGLVVGLILLGFAAVVLTQGSIFGIGFSQDLKMLSTYWALPIGVVLLLVNIKHTRATGPTVVAAKNGITLRFTSNPVGPIAWSEIKGFTSFQYRGKWYLGVTLVDPAKTLTPMKDDVLPLVRTIGPKKAHLTIPGAMMDDYMTSIERELDELRQIHTWRA
ncbi:MAG TPA: hypothetical protein VMY41_20460 [Thermohalobaculum sp.]|nr:hypothetical protein [Thermohalobaculum sp.]